MGDIPNDNSTDRNFFPTTRSDIPQQQATQAFQGEVYTNYQPTAPGRTTEVGRERGYVTIHESNGDTIYAARGSVIYEGRHNSDRFAQVGGGQNGYYANPEQPSPAQWAPPGLPPRPYYNGYNTGYQNVGSGGWEMPPPYQPNPIGSVIGGVLGAIGGAFLFGGRRFGCEPYSPYMPPMYAQAPMFGGYGYGFGGGRGIGIAMSAMAGAAIGSAVANPQYNYYNQGGYYNQGAYYNQTPYFQPQPYGAGGYGYRM